MYPLLEKMKIRPGLYFGKPSITRLNIFIHGYNFAYVEEGKLQPIDLGEFQGFIEAIYSEKRSLGWADIILEDCGDEEEAFWKFYELFDEFERQQIVVGKFLERYVDMSIYLDHKLIWNSLKQKISENIVVFSNDEGVERVKQLETKDLMLYDERVKLLQKQSLNEIINTLSILEIWEEKDLYIFDESMEWFIAFTHEDMVIVYGIK